MTSDDFCPFLTPLPLIRCFISVPLLIKSDLAEYSFPPPSDVIYGRPLIKNVKLKLTFVTNASKQKTLNILAFKGLYGQGRVSAKIPL